MKLLASLLFLFFFYQSSHGLILTSPEMTKWGDWFYWSNCPPGTFVKAFSLNTQPHGGATTDDTALNGIRFYCGGIKEITEPVISITSGTEYFGNWGKKFLCGGVVTGFQMRSENSQGAIVDDTAGNNLKIFCNGEKTNPIEGDGLTFGSWTAERHCNPQQAFCALRTQVEVKNNRVDETALNNFSVECCDIPDPADLCEPILSWEPILHCKNLHGESDKKCNLETRKGVSYSPTIDPNVPYTNGVYEKLGFDLSNAAMRFNASFAKKKMDWGKIGVETFAQDFIQVEGHKTARIEQLVATCGIYQIKSNLFKRFDVDLNNLVVESEIKF